MAKPIAIDKGLAETPGALTKLGCAMMHSGQGAKAAAIVRHMRQERPNDPELAEAERTILSHGVPQWHAAMLADLVRNDAFERAIVRATPRDGLVLDIGTGSGLLAMMAARAGAGHVVACEAHPAVAETAREIVALNGYARTIEVVAKHSTALERAHDLSGGADLIVSEVFSADLIGEGALATIADAMHRLARPGARILPSAATIRAALAWHDKARAGLPGQVSGFDLACFGRHVTPYYMLKPGEPRLELRSAPHDLFDFDFQTGGPFPAERKEADLVSTGGAVNGVVQWIRLQLGPDEVFENRPMSGASSHWAAIFRPLPRAIETRSGDTVGIAAAHDGERLSLWFRKAGSTERA